MDFRYRQRYGDIVRQVLKTLSSDSLEFGPKGSGVLRNAGIFPLNCEPAVGGTQVIVVPTNETLATHELSGLLIRARAYENRVYCLWSNR